MKYYISKDKARPNVDNFTAINQCLKHILNEDVVVEKEFIIPFPFDFNKVYNLFFSMGYIFHRVYM